MSEQLELFETAQPAPSKKRPLRRDVNREAKEWLDRTGISTMQREIKIIIAAKLMAEWHPEMHKTLLMALATTSIKLPETQQQSKIEDR